MLVLLPLLLSVFLSRCLANPVFFPEEVSDEYFTVLPSYFKFSFEAADSPNVPAGGSSASAAQKENADKDKLGEKALVDETLDDKVKSPGALGSGGVYSDEDDSASDEKENSTEPVKKLLIRTFTDLNPKVALELINKTMSIINETEAEEAKNIAGEYLTNFYGEFP